MKYVYIEAANNKQPEYKFLQTYADSVGLKDIEFKPVGGKDNLKNLKNELLKQQLENNVVAILFDADSIQNRGGYSNRIREINDELSNIGVRASIFLWPNNRDDGDFETMLDNIVRRDIHKEFFDCFEDYEKCVAKSYNVPNLKGKLHTFVTAQKGLTNQQKKNISSDWFFDNGSLWNLSSPYLNPLKDFLLSL